MNPIYPCYVGVAMVAWILFQASSETEIKIK